MFLLTRAIIMCVDVGRELLCLLRYCDRCLLIYSVSE
jgi:hypothetical protein